MVDCCGGSQGFLSCPLKLLAVVMETFFSVILQVHLGDSALVIEVERDYTVYGDELKFGGGKVTSYLHAIIIIIIIIIIIVVVVVIKLL